MNNFIITTSVYYKLLGKIVYFLYLKTLFLLKKNIISTIILYVSHITKFKYIPMLKI